MSWTLRVYDPLNTTLKATVVDGVLSGVAAIAGAPTANVQPYDDEVDCLSMTFTGRNDRLQIGPLDIVQYLIDSNEVFWGPVVVLPVADSPGAGPADQQPGDLRNFEAAGGKWLLERTYLRNRIFDLEADVSVALLAALIDRHVALLAPGGNFPVTGLTPNLIASPYKDLWTLCQELAQSVPGGRVGVNAKGEVWFRGDLSGS